MGIEILVVDPENETRIFLKTLLETRGHRVQLAETLHQAIEALNRNVPELTIVDSRCLESTMKGFKKHFKNIPIITISAIPLRSLCFQQKVLESDGILDEPFPFLEKPLQEDDLFNLMTSLLERQASPDSIEEG